jgi:hypothetical protein
LTPEEVKKEEERWQKDVKQVGKATCPVCGLELGYGPGGIVNLIGQHLHTERCDEAKAKRDKQPRENGSMLNFFAPKLPPVPPTVHTPAPVAFRAPIASKNPAPVTGKTSAAPALTSASVSAQASLPLLGLMRQLRDNIRRLPLAIPEADETNPLSVFSGDPASYVGEDVTSDTLWEELAPTFHKAFNYGHGVEERVCMIQTGPHGLGGFMRFLDYFVVKRGLRVR